MFSPIPAVQDVVLIGGGHSHVAVLKQFGMKPIPGVRITLISRDIETPYSGMLPGVVAGHYSHDEAHIDLVPLARFANARAVFDEAIGVDLSGRQVLFRHRPPIAYDVLSINTGSTPRATVPGSSSHAVPVKPIDRFLGHWNAMRERLGADRAARRIAVVGGGTGGVELLLAVQYRLRTLPPQDSNAPRFEYHLFTDTDTILPTHNARVRATFRRILEQRGVIVHTGRPVVEVSPQCVRMADGATHQLDEILWTTEASAAPWLAESGLAVDESGFVRVSRTLESVSHPRVFAAGDAASMVDDPRPKSGVFAVRQGRPLARNLRRSALGQSLTRYRPQRRALSLISTGDACAVASRGPVTLRGQWVWRWKDWLDRRFMRTYADLQA